MLTPVRSPLGAPGVFALPDARLPAFNPQRMDVCAFVGVAPRGPANVPLVDENWPSGYRMVSDVARPRRRSQAVAVRSFDEYVHHFGGFEGPGLLPHAVASYFEQGGRLAWIVRIVHARDAALADACAIGKLRGAFTADLDFVARNEGTWGNRLGVAVEFSTSALAFSLDPLGRLLVDPRSALAVGCCLRLTDALGVATLAFCTGLQRVRDRERARERWRLALDGAPASPPLRAELVSASVSITDGAGRRERFENLALSPDHPESLASVLCDRSTLLWPHPDWAATRLVPLAARLETLRGSSTAFAGGRDDWSTIIADDFFDSRWSVADDRPGAGISALAHSETVSQLVVPDLYVAAQWAGPEVVEERVSSSAGAEFAACLEVTTSTTASRVPPSALCGLIVDPRTQAGLATIVGLQQRVLDFCESTQAVIALFDVPPGLSQARIEQWRAQFDSGWAAAYHPWLVPARRTADAVDPVPARRDQLPPSAVAAGIIARREFAYGIQYGPANEIARQIIHLAEAQPEGRADALHGQGINCFARGPDGIALLAARTLSRERDWRQLSVRRLILMLRRTLLAEMQWAVFEPNGPDLWRDLQHAIESLLRGLFRRGAFVGRSESESFFVRVHTETPRLERGELLIDIGVAPAEPLEFLLVRLRRDGDGTLNLEE
ncbi:phage tail sheath C-terminal domain-containing protein [Accumulibacter sp.]|uniref:phage tail sheath C-terminal domain-containing protein n=1 Tax=Accumulibacter sp. TaxID=2053492 RepID=UPI00262D105A|nr:phage tail sheath C-terminal domain-containing protein [Accumulibacter sp.]